MAPVACVDPEYVGPTTPTTCGSLVNATAAAGDLAGSPWSSSVWRRRWNGFRPLALACAIASRAASFSVRPYCATGPDSGPSNPIVSTGNADALAGVATAPDGVTARPTPAMR